jgi:hypothetical protein
MLTTTNKQGIEETKKNKETEKGGSKIRKKYYVILHAFNMDTTRSQADDRPNHRAPSAAREVT